MRRSTYLLSTALVTGCSFAANISDDAQPHDGHVVDGVRDAAAVDARAIDAPPDAPRSFDVTTCPGNYVEVAGITAARYRAGATSISVPWGDAAQACEADSVGLTHLVVFDSQAEYDAVVGPMQAAHNSNYSWTGGYSYFDVFVRSRNVTGQSRVTLRFLDGAIGAEVLKQPRGSFVRDDLKYSDNPVGYTYNYICECDGRPGGQRPPNSRSTR